MNIELRLGGDGVVRVSFADYLLMTDMETGVVTVDGVEYLVFGSSVETIDGETVEAVMLGERG
jgi:hypothetical protein